MAPLAGGTELITWTHKPLESEKSVGPMPFIWTATFPVSKERLIKIGSDDNQRRKLKAAR